MKVLSSTVFLCCSFSAACVAEDVARVDLPQGEATAVEVSPQIGSAIGFVEGAEVGSVGQKSTAAVKDDTRDDGAEPMRLAPGTGPIVIRGTNCGSWPGNGIADHDIESRTVSYGGRTVRIALVNQRFSDHSFAAVRSGYATGDQTWVDRSYDEGRTWSQCGPFNSKLSNDLSNLNNWMRACVRFSGGSFCTAWHYDT